MRENTRISVIIPALNESGWVARAVTSTRPARETEVLVVDGQSEDRTLEVARQSGARVLTAARGRAAQMNAGARAATGELLLFLHADSRLPAGFDGEVRRLLARPDVAAGAFRLAIDPNSRALRLIAAVANWRARRLELPYGDQALFLHAGLFEDLGGFPELPLMEDFELVRRLRRRGRIAIAPRSVRTSARRWRELGVGRTTLINQLAVAAYLAGVDPASIARWYGVRGPGRGGPR